MIIKFWGTRGSVPVPGKDTIKYGGNTPCVEVQSSSAELIILDGGSGIRELGNKLIENKSRREINIFISHYHWDHIQGIPFFLPLYDKNRKIIFHGLSSNGSEIEKILSVQMQPEYFPVKIEEAKAEIEFRNLNPGDIYKVSNLSIETSNANHSSPTLAYKISEGNKSIVYMTDNEIHWNDYPENLNLSNQDDNIRRLVKFCSNCDYLIHDTMYDESLFKEKIGWGHSSNISLAYFSIFADIKNLVLFHYNPDYSDSKIDEMYEETCSLLKKKKSKINCIAAQEGMEINL
jgi:phosphoribosyl 1,2-cyclic phosphodiesterase